jgi:succinylarginine dihydrolase
VLIERAHRGFGDGEPGGEIAVHLALGRALVLTQPANAHEHIIAIRGTGRRQALGLSREQTHARARTRRVRAAARSRGNGEEAIERLHGLIPSQVVSHNQEVTAMEAGQQFRVINDALFGV